MKKEIVFVSLIVACAGARVAFGGLLYEPSCYVAQESLALNLDGIRNVGALKAHDSAATEWKDLSHTANNAVFIAKEGDASAWTADGYHFAGGCYGKLKSAQDFGDAITVQIVADVTRSDSTTTWPSLFGNWNDRLNIYCNGNDVLFKADHSTGLSWTSRSKLTSWGGKYLNAALDAVAYKQILVQTASFQTGWVEGSKSEKASVGSQQWSFGSAGNGGNFDQSNLDARYLVGTIKAIRVYKKVLSNTELAANRAIDEARFFAGIPVTNVVVATAVPTSPATPSPRRRGWRRTACPTSARATRSSAGTGRRGARRSCSPARRTRPPTRTRACASRGSGARRAAWAARTSTRSSTTT